MKKILFLFAVMAFVLGRAQTNDELKSLISSSSGIQKSQYLIQLANNIKNDHPSEAFQYAVEGVKLAEGNKSLEGPGNAIASQTALSLKKYDDAATYGKKAADIFEGTDTKNYAVSVATVADAYAASSDWSKAITYDEKAYNAYVSLGKEKNAAYSAVGVAQGYQNKKDLKNAIKWYETAANKFGNEGDASNQVQCLQSAGALYSNYGDYATAKKYLVSALDIAKKNGLTAQANSIQSNLDIVDKNVSTSQTTTAFESEKEQEKEAYISAMEVSQAKSLAEIEQLSEEVQLAELKVKAKQDEANILNLKNQQLELEKQQAETEKNLALAEAEKSEAISREAEARSQTLWLAIGGLIVIVLLVFIGFLLKMRSAKILEAKNIEISHQKDEILKQNKNIQQSIDYATRIQQALLPSNILFQEVVSDSFVFLKPKDNVSGDFFWFHQLGDGYIAAAADCTGHGVPGAFMSIIFSNLLDKAVIEEGITSPEKILERICEMLTRKLADRKITEKEFKDGMDVAIIKLNKGGELSFSGARNPIYIVTENELTEMKATKRSVGVNKSGESKPFELHRQQLQKGNKIFMFSDGFADQKGGPKGKKFYYPPFKELLVAVSGQSIQGASSTLSSVYNDWRGKNEQFDDVLVVGIEVS